MTTVTEPTLFDAIPSAPVDAQTASLLELIASDRIHADDAARVVAAIVRTAQDNDGTVDPNALRALLWNEHGCIVKPPVIGATISALRHARTLEPAGWVPTEGSTTGNNGRPACVYRYHAP